MPRTPRQRPLSLARQLLCWLGLGLLTASAAVPDAAAQRPFRTHDPFYRNETARRYFFDGYALSGEVSYRPAGSVQGDGLRAPSADPFGLSFRFDYQLAARFDASVIVDAAAGATGRTLSLSWVALKYYRTVDQSDYAFRLAVDPARDGQVGFPQLDLGFLYTSLLAPDFSMDFALGVRRVRIGYQQFVFPDPVPTDGEGGNPPPQQATDPDVVFSRALGWELHAMLSYNLLFDPAGSNMFFEVLGETGNYDLVETVSRFDGDPDEDDAAAADAPTSYRGGVVWLRSGLQFDRPSYQVIPFLGLPLTQWSLDEGDWPSHRMHIGLRLMLR